MKNLYILILLIISICGETQEIQPDIILYSNNEMMECLEPCHFTSSSKQFVSCKGPANANTINITCDTNSYGTIEIGRRESIRKLLLNSLDNLILELTATQKNFISITFRLNFFHVLKGNFDQLKDFEINLNLLNIVRLHPDAFFNLRKLISLDIQTKIPPKYVHFENDDLPDPSEMNLNGMSKENLIPFIRLQPDDMTRTIIFNIPVCCHSCLNTDIIIVTFLCGNPSPLHDNMFILFPSTCDAKQNALGCPVPKNTTEPFFMPSKEISPVVEPKSGEVKGFQKAPNNGVINKEIQLTLILLSIWCTLITLTLIIFICIFCRCCRNKTSSSSNKWLNLFYPNSLYSRENGNLLTIQRTPSTTLATNSNTISNNSNKGTLYDLQYNQLETNSQSDCDESLTSPQNVVVPKKRNFTFLNGSISHKMAHHQDLYNESVNQLSLINDPYNVPKERKSKKKRLDQENGVYVNHDMLNACNYTIRISNENINGINCIEIP